MFSIITPMDTNRLEQFLNTKREYDKMPQVKEFIIPTRSIDKVRKFLKDNDLMKDVKLISYKLSPGFNCSKALNIGVRKAKYKQVIITSPEVRPEEGLLGKLEELIGANVLCHVSDEDEKGNLTPLIMTGYRSGSPAMYFLAMFNKKDIEKINGWDEYFTKGYAYEDDDFGERWNRAGLPFMIRDDIRAIHQYHPRGETIVNGTSTNFLHYSDNNNNGIIWVENGLIKGKKSAIL